MTMAKIFAGGVGLAALASAAPAIAQIYPFGISASAAVDRCAAAVQNRLSYRSAYGDYASGRVLSVTRVQTSSNRVHVRGIATSGRTAYYAPYGIGAFGMLGSNYSQRADLSFRCTVDYRGRVRDIDINRR